MTRHTHTVLFPFCGAGGGALGFLQASRRHGGTEHRFVSLGGIDNDPTACAAFEYLTQSPAWGADISKLQPADLRNRYGDKAPDVVFASPPCRGFSRLLGSTKANEPQYQALNLLVLQWVALMLATWDTPPRMFLLENVSGILSRGKGLLAQVVSLLQRAGYATHGSVHDAGELGGLAQHRPRYLLIARHEPQVGALLYQPPRLRVRGVGEVLGQLLMPGDPGAGKMHVLPRLTWRTWLRLAAVPAGGDWRDLNGVLPDGAKRREVFKRHGVQDWAQPSSTVTGTGSNGVNAVADPRARAWFKGVLGVTPWHEPAPTITGRADATTGRFAVADPRAELCVKTAYPHGYGVLRWDGAAWTIAAGSQVGQGAYAVADPRIACAPRAGAYGVLDWQESSPTVTGHACHDNGRFSVADPRPVTSPFEEPLDLDVAPRHAPVILAADGTWHRPLTPLDLAVLQGLEGTLRGQPLELPGSSSTAWRQHIGNMVPVGTAKAIAEQMLRTLAHAAAGTWELSASGVWVDSEDDAPALEVMQ